MIPRIAAGFARHLQSYDAAALAQARIAERLAASLMPLTAARSHVMELGHGTGLLTRHLAQLGPDEVWLNDLVAPLPDLPWQAGTRVHAMPGDATGLTFPRGLDLVASASMIQWLADPRALLHRACGTLCRHGLLAVSSFGPDNFPELAGPGLAPGAPSYRDAKGLCRDLPGDMRVLAAWDESIPVAFPDALTLFAHLRATGVNGLMGGRLSSPQLRAMMRQMNRDGRTTLTYRPSYCIARRS